MAGTDLALERPTMTSNIPKKSVERCPACDGTARRVVMDVREHEYDTTTDDTFQMQECLDCGAWFLDPRPHESALDIIYPPNYYAYANKPGTKESVRGGFTAMLFKRRMKPFFKYLEISPSTRWLEVGCAQGWIFESLRDVYGVTDVVGVDYSASAIEVCRSKGFEAYASRVEDFQAPAGRPFDVVHSNHVIEHVDRPKEYMEKAFELLEPGGYCIFATPNRSVWESKFFGPNWGGLHVPRHWTLFDKDSVKALGERVGFVHKATEFSVLGVFWTWSFHSWLQERSSRRLADLFFPSDERINSSAPANLLRLTAVNLLDLAMVGATGESANMLCVFQKPATRTPSVT